MSDGHGGKKDEKKPPEGEIFVGADALFWILLFLVGIAFIGKVPGFLGLSVGPFPSLSSIFASFFNTFQVFSVFLSLLFFLGIIYFNFKLGELSSHSHGHGHDSHATSTASHVTYSGASMMKDSHGHAPDKRWQNVLNRIESNNESDWRLAVIECDIVLDEMLTKMGYHGANMGDKLKQVEKSDFNTIDDAWEGHKFRNRIAHDGASFHVTRGEAERVVNLYKKVFEEFYFI